MRNLGYIQSPRDDRDFIFGVPEPSLLSIPSKYMLKDLHECYDQGEDPICAAVCISSIIYWQTMNEVDLDPFKIFDLRSNKNMQGMIPREALNGMQKKGVGRYKIGRYARVSTPEQAKAAILTNGPIMICVNAYDKDDFWVPGGEFLGGHAVQLTGWDKDGFWLQNSWGPEWGRAGGTVFPEKDWTYVLEAWTILLS